MGDFDRESMLDMFTFEMNQLLQSLEQNIIQGESGYTMDKINEIFRVMHTIKGSAAMMLFDNVSKAAHAIEDLFYYLREENPPHVDASKITDLVLETLDFIKEEIAKIEDGLPSDGDCSGFTERIKAYLKEIKGVPDKPAAKNTADSKKTDQKVATSATSAPKEGYTSYQAIVKFDEGCEMENIRAFTLVNNLKPVAENITHVPEDIIDEGAIEYIRNKGFSVSFASKQSYDEISELLKSTIYLDELILNEIKSEETINAAETNVYTAYMRFDDGCEMENVRSFSVVHNLAKYASVVKSEPEDLIDEGAIEVIRKNGLKLTIYSVHDYDEIYNILNETLYLKELSLEEPQTETDNNNGEAVIMSEKTKETNAIENQNTNSNSLEQEQKQIVVPAVATPAPAAKKGGGQHVISVSVNKLDELLKLMGELVISEAMVTQNPELDSLELESFHKEARQLRKIIKDIQDNVMSMRMVPLSTTFFKMHRIVRDMCKQLEKDIVLDILGEETEVDKNIIEHISDPLMHIIRNSADHGIETPEKRRAAGKSEKGTILLEAKNSGSDVLIVIKDDGAGLNREKILQKAKNNGLLKKTESEYTDREIHQFIFLPGFSTNEKVTNFSGRGVGMDVVSKNLEMVGGTVMVDSVPGEGSTFTLKIPLTLAIIEGMMIKMGGSKYTLPIISIKDSFVPSMKDVFIDPSGNEMITVRNECYNIVRLYQFFGVESEVTNLEEGIMIMVENGDDTICLFIDELVGEQQVVVKSMPKYFKKIKGISGCTLLGNGDISLILDVAGFFDR